jgi:RecA/RadA recombinase
MPRPAARSRDEARVSSGIGALDELLGLGYRPGASTLVAGPSGSGKTLMGLHFIFEGLRREEPWSEIQAMFVDDPRASIERAAGLVDDRVEALIQSVRERQRSMQSAWRADDAGTEELRVALQHYRSFWNTLADLPAQG